MSARHMQGDTPDARAVGPARLDGYRLAFNVASRSWGGGGVNVTPALEGSVWGVLWEIRDESMEAFNSFRGDESAYHVLDVEVHGPDGPARATTFAIDSPEQFVRPVERYVQMLAAAARAQGLPQDAVEAIHAAAQGPRGLTPSSF